MAFENESRAARTVREVFESGRPLTYIRSAEEQRVAKLLGEVAAHLAAPSTVPGQLFLELPEEGVEASEDGMLDGRLSRLFLATDAMCRIAFSAALFTD